MCSCASTYRFVQVMKTEPVDKTGMINVDGGMDYEDANCLVHYTLWSEGGELTFSIYNKTDKIIFVNLYKSFFIKNEHAFDYTTKFREQSVVAIPPKAFKVLSGFIISELMILDCDLTRFPTDSASISYTEDNSPLVFSNYLTYNVDNNAQEWTIENKFYISKVTNYAQPVYRTFILRSQKPCQNLTDEIGNEYTPNYPFRLYDSVYNFDNSNCFFINYDKVTRHRIYKKTRSSLEYSEYHNGYIRYF